MHLLTLGVVVVVAALAHLAARVVHVPPVPAFIAAGLVVRPLVPDAPALIEGFLLVSLAFLLFSAGVNLNPSRVARATRGRLALFGILGAFLAGLPGAALAHLAGWSPLAIPYAAVTVGLSSTLIALAVLAERGQMTDAHARLLVGGLLAQDLAAFVLLAVVPNVPSDPRLAGIQLAGTLGIVALAAIVMRVSRLRAVWRIAPTHETRTLLAFGLVFAFLLVARFVGAPLAAGALFAGLAVASFPANVHARPAIRAARDFFTPFFFVLLGAFFPLPELDDLPFLAGLVLLILIVKPLVLALVARSLAFTRRASADAALLAAQGSEFALILALYGALAGELTARQFGLLGFAVAITMLVSPALPHVLIRPLMAVIPRETAAPTVPHEGHVVVLGAGRTGQRVVELLYSRGVSVVAVDADAHALAQIPRDVPRILGDVTRDDVLRAAHAATARAAVVLVATDEAAVATARTARERLSAASGLVVTRTHSDEAQRVLEDADVHVVRPGESFERAFQAVLDAVSREEDERPESANP